MAKRFSVEAVITAVNKFTAPVSRMQNSVQKFARVTTRALRKVNRVFDKVVGGLRKGLGKIARFGGAVGLALGTATVLAINRVADAADALAKRSRRLQFPIEALQEWQFVAQQSGIATEEFDKSLERFTKSVGEAKSGTGTLVTILKKANPELLAQIQGAEGVAQAFDLYLEAIRKTKDQTVKTALATAAFGRTGAKFLNITEQSTKAVRALRLEQRQNGNITEDQAAAAEAYNDAVNSLKRSLGGLLQGVILPLLPAITKTVRAWREWVIANKELVRGRVLRFVKDLKDRFKRLVAAVIEFNKRYNLAELFRKTLDVSIRFASFMSRNGATILTVVAAVVALSLVLKTLAVAMALINVLAAINPLGLMVIGVLALVAGLALLVTWIDTVVTKFGGLSPTMRVLLAPIEALVRAIKFIKDNFKDVLNPGGFLFDKARGLFNREDEATSEGSQVQAQVFSPQERIARSIEEKSITNTAEIRIKDDSGRAEIVKSLSGVSRLLLERSGVF